MVDQTGSIDCVVGAWPSATGKLSATEHRCVSDDCVANVSSGQAGVCPFIQTSLLGAVVRVDRFQLVVETFQMSNGDAIVVCPYIQFAVPDLFQLCGQPRPNSYPLLNSTSVSNRLTDSENAESQQRITGVNHDGSTLSATSPRQIDYRNDSCEDMFASFVASPSSQIAIVPSMATGDCSQAPTVPDTATVNRCRCSISQLFIVDCCENISLYSRHIEQLSLYFTATGYFVGPPKLSGCGCPKSAGISVPARLPTMRPVAVLFRSRSVRWYSILHSGCVYRLVLLSSDVSPFLGKFMLPRTKKTLLERHVSRCLVVLESNLDVERVVVSSPCYRDLMLSVEEDAAVSAAVDEVHGRLKHGDEFWQQHSVTASVR